MRALLWFWLWLRPRGTRGVYTLSVVTPVGDAIAGETFGQQPEVSVLDDGVIDTTYEGFVYAQLENSPTGFEELKCEPKKVGANNRRKSGRIASQGRQLLLTQCGITRQEHGGSDSQESDGGPSEAESVHNMQGEVGPAGQHNSSQDEVSTQHEGARSSDHLAGFSVRSSPAPAGAPWPRQSSLSPAVKRAPERMLVYVAAQRAPCC